MKPAWIFPLPAEIAAIIRAAKGRWRPLLIVAAFTGLRASELRGLRWTDVDLKAGVTRVAQRADKHGQIGPPKSKAGRRTVPIGPFVVNTLKEWRLQNPHALVFCNGAGNVESLENIVQRGLIPTLTAAGLKGKYGGMHAFRHFYASWCINRKADGGLELPPKTIQTRLGHSSITMTFDRYGHLFPTDDDGKEMAAAVRAIFAT